MTGHTLRDCPDPFGNCNGDEVVVHRVPNQWAVSCDCGQTVRAGTKAEAIAAWNHRTDHTADLMAALDGVIAAFPSYRTRNGKSVSIEACDGEKCWIIHDDVRSDAINARAAIAKALGK